MTELKMIGNIQYTDEEVTLYEHKLEAERQKCQKTIERTQQEMDSIDVSGGVFGKNKAALKQVEELKGNLQDLEDHLIELNTMSGLDYLVYCKTPHKKSFDLGVFNTVGDVVETVGKVLPIPGSSKVAGMLGKTFKNIGKLGKKK